MFWKTFSIDEQKLYYSKIGPLEIWIKRHSHDWYIAYKRESQEPGFIELTFIDPLPDESTLPWTRWVLTTKSHIITFMPIMPDRAVIIKPEIPVKIPPGNSGKFYVNIPVWVKIEIGDKNPTNIIEIPVYILSKSWFGNTSSGELCYSKTSLVRKNFEELEPGPCSSICSVIIKNNSKLVLNFERFWLNVANLSIFSNTQRFCTNHVEVVFRGEEQESQITISKSHSNFLKNCKLISNPRKPLDRNIIKMSYKFIKTITGISFLFQ